jgi:hypothetical protein
MPSGAELGSFVPSINPPNQVETWGFELAEDAAHMIAWLGRGRDFRRFVVNDIESELYRQTPGAQLLAVRCNDKPDFNTTARQDDPSRGAVVTGVSVTFPVTARVRAADGAIWKLDIKHNYDAANIHLHDDRRQLRLNFTIAAHFQEA